MVEGIQIKKIPLTRQADSLFGDEDLMRLGDGELRGMVEQYFGNDSEDVLDYLCQRREHLLAIEDQRTYHQKRKEREYRYPLHLNREKDADIIEWLQQFNEKATPIKEAIRFYMKKSAK